MLAHHLLYFGATFCVVIVSNAVDLKATVEPRQAGLNGKVSEPVVASSENPGTVTEGSANGNTLKFETGSVVDKEKMKSAETEAPVTGGAQVDQDCLIANRSQYSWLVKIYDVESEKQVCTGTVITDEDVFVPASCFLKDVMEEVPRSFYDLPKKILAIAGGSASSNCSQQRNVTAIYPHKGYFADRSEQDYAFLKVSPPFDVDLDDTPELTYHLNVINSEGALVYIHNEGPFCQSPYFLDDGLNARITDNPHLLGTKVEDCFRVLNCTDDIETCLDKLYPAIYACLKPLTPRRCSPRDRGAPLICNDVFHGYLHSCDGESPIIFRGLSKAIKFLELEDDHVQKPGYVGAP